MKLSRGPPKRWDTIHSYFSTSRHFRINRRLCKRLHSKLQKLYSAFTRPFPPRAEVGWPARLTGRHVESFWTSRREIWTSRRVFWTSRREIRSGRDLETPGRHQEGFGRHVTSRDLDITWRHLDVTWRHLDVTWRHLDVTLGCQP